MAFDQKQPLSSRRDNFMTWGGAANYTNTFSNSNSFTSTNTYNSSTDSHSINVYHSTGASTSQPAYSSMPYHTWHGFSHPWNKRRSSLKGPLSSPSSPTPSPETSPCKVSSGEKIGQGHQVDELGDRATQRGEIRDRMTYKRPRFRSADSNKGHGQTKDVVGSGKKSRFPLSPEPPDVVYRSDSFSSKSRSTSHGLIMSAAMFCCWIPNDDDF